MGIAVLSHNLAGTGVVRNGVRIANLAHALGLETEYWVVRPQGALAPELDPGVKVRVLGQHWVRHLPRKLAGFTAIPALSRLIRERHPAIVFSAGNHFHLATGAAYRLAGSPACVRLAGRASNAVPGIERLGVFAPFLRPVARLLDRAKYAGMNPVIAVAAELGEELQGLGISRDRIRVIANGVDTATLDRLAQAALDHPWFQENGPPVILAAGRLARQKNYPLLLEAFALARKCRELRLVILGRGTPEALAKLQARAKALGIAEDVRFEGFVPNPYAYFARAGLFVLSSRWEGMSNVLQARISGPEPV